MLNTTFETFFPAKMGNKIMVEITCEPLGNCDVDQRSFKAHLSQWLAATAQLVPARYETIFPYLRASAVGAAGQCDGGSNGITCGREWNTTVYDNTNGVGEQMSALAVIQSCMLDVATLTPPYTSTSGGTSKSDPNAGTGTSSSSSSGGSAVTYSTLSTSDRAGAGVLTALIIVVLLGGTAWMLVA